MAAPAPFSDITEHISRKGVYGLNLATSTSHENLFIGDKRIPCRSDADSQMILYFPFNQTVKVFSMILDGPPEEAPTVVKLYVNLGSLGFEDVDVCVPTHTQAIDPEGLGREIRLKFAKFQAVNSLHMFVEREGATHSALSKVTFIGAPVHTTDMREFNKKTDEE